MNAKTRNDPRAELLNLCAECRSVWNCDAMEQFLVVHGLHELTKAGAKV